MAMTSETKVVLALLAVGAAVAGYYVYRQKQKQQPDEKGLPPKTPASLPEGAQTPQSSSMPPSGAASEGSFGSGPAQPPTEATRASTGARSVARAAFSRRAIPKGAHTLDAPNGTWWWLEDGGLFDPKTASVSNLNPSPGPFLTLHSPTGNVIKVPAGATFGVTSGALRLPAPQD